MTDREFIEAISEDELSDVLLEELDYRMKSEGFRERYERFLEEKYTRPFAKILADYIPFILFTILIIIGLYLL